MNIAALVFGLVVLASSLGLFTAAKGPLKNTSSAKTLLLFSGVQLVLALLLVAIAIFKK